MSRVEWESGFVLTQNGKSLSNLLSEIFGIVFLFEKGRELGPAYLTLYHRGILGLIVIRHAGIWIHKEKPN